MAVLPIDPLLPDVVGTLREHPSAVIEAPPGAGKTTRVPRALLEAGLAERGEIVVLEPRRLPARLAARFVASELGEEVGGRVGYQVRFEEAVSARTRLRFVTEGLLLRRLLASSRLEGVAAVVFDEFHERHLETDLSLALLHRLQQTERPELRLLVMSATLDAEPVARFLGDAPRLRSEGRQYEVTIEHTERPDDRPLEARVAGAVRRLLREEPSGHILVFLPGVAEIRRAQQACDAAAREHDALVLPLYGDLSPAEQDRAVRPTSQRKVILATNVAETSVTIEDVTAVVDTGLARVASHNSWSGMRTLQLKRISQASAAQRAGRAGRTRPGRCLRLYGRMDLVSQPEFDKPEILRADLADAVLMLRALGVVHTHELDWLDAPPQEAVSAAEGLLAALHAIDAKGRLTQVGEQLLRLPVHPRLGRIVVEAQRRGVVAEGCTIAALLGERDVRVGRGPAQTSHDSDVLLLAELFARADEERFERRRVEALGLNGGAVRTVARARDQLLRAVRAGAERVSRRYDAKREQAALISVLAGYPDRVARRRASGAGKSGGAELLLASGGAARLADSSVVQHAEWMVALDVEEGGARDRRDPLVRLASAIEPDWLIDLFADDVVEVNELQWNEHGQRVEEVSRMSFGALTLDETRRRASSSPQATALLVQRARQAGLASFVDAEALEALLRRLRFVRRHGGAQGLLELDEAGLWLLLEEACQGATSFGELREAGLLALLQAHLTPEQRRALEQQAPERVTLPGGRQLPVHYENDQPPWVESWLQDFFGLGKGPAVAGGRVPLTLHLLAPNRRPVQVTTDLEGFWERHYPELKKSLSRRYPKHSWPDDPRRAQPPAPRGRR